MIKGFDERNSAQKGFTLIELVIVIVILGILSAFALPRFADLGGDARAAAIEGAAGSIKSANSIVRSACLASSDCDQSQESGESIDLEGQTVNVAYGYPTADTSTTGAGGILVAAQISGNDFTINDAGGTPAEVQVQADGAVAPANCQVSFTQAGGTDTPPVIDTDVSDC